MRYATPGAKPWYDFLQPGGRGGECVNPGLPTLFVGSGRILGNLSCINQRERERCDPTEAKRLASDAAATVGARGQEESKKDRPVLATVALMKTCRGRQPNL